MASFSIANKTGEVTFIYFEHSYDSRNSGSNKDSKFFRDHLECLIQRIGRRFDKYLSGSIDVYVRPYKLDGKPTDITEFKCVGLKAFRVDGLEKFLDEFLDEYIKEAVRRTMFDLTHIY